MKKIMAAVTALAGVLYFGILWVNNLVSAGRYHVLLLHGELAASDRTPSGFWPALDWSMIDLSTITTFIPFFGFALISWRLWRPAPSGDVPFFAGYDRLNIALGLLGTIWGIILVGFYPSDQVSIAALMRCLHTAMFSTLAAVLWVMVLLPTVFVPLMRFCAGGPAEEEAGLDQLIDRISTGLHTAAEELREGTKGAAEFRTELAGAVESLRKAREAEITWQRSAADTLNALAETVCKLDVHQQKLLDENTRLSGENTELKRNLAESEEAVDRLKQTIGQIRNALEK